MYKFKTLFIITFLLSAFQLQAQQRTIQGTVTDETGMPVPGVNILIKGSNVGSTTDAEGKYQVNIEEEVTLIFSMIGFQDQEVSTNGRNRIDVELSEESFALGEVVVMGYNEVERRHLASSIEEMDVDKIKTRPIAKLEQAFSGTIAGVTLLQGNNLPGSVPGTISIRGISTLQNASPLVIVDGMEQSLTDIDPNQVKSITVLKDAASAAMYGSRGANGVIIIETERGTTGQFKVDLHAWTAISDPIDLPNFVNSADYMSLNNEARSMQGQTELYSSEDITLARQGQYTDWLDEVMERQASSYNASASISGGGGCRYL
ncbi:MAG: carboxypeptidase-like regulatory domain-containing protein [Anditalea sp.]